MKNSEESRAHPLVRGRKKMGDGNCRIAGGLSVTQPEAVGLLSLDVSSL